MALSEVKALTFDVFGTVVNWRDSIAREAKSFLGPKGYEKDWKVWHRNVGHHHQYIERALRRGLPRRAWREGWAGSPGNPARPASGDPTGRSFWKGQRDVSHDRDTQRTA